MSTYDIGSYPRDRRRDNHCTAVAPNGRDAEQRLDNDHDDVGDVRRLGLRTARVRREPSGHTTITYVASPTRATLSRTAPASGAFGLVIGYDCNTQKAPFNVQPFTGSSGGNCQTGDDSNAQNVDVQLFDTGPAGEADTLPVSDCHQLA